MSLLVCVSEHLGPFEIVSNSPVRPWMIQIEKSVFKFEKMESQHPVLLRGKSQHPDFLGGQKSAKICPSILRRSEHVKNDFLTPIQVKIHVSML